MLLCFVADAFAQLLCWCCYYADYCHYFAAILWCAYFADITLRRWYFSFLFDVIISMLSSRCFDYFHAPFDLLMLIFLFIFFLLMPDYVFLRYADALHFRASLFFAADYHFLLSLLIAGRHYFSCRHIVSFAFISMPHIIDISFIIFNIAAMLISPPPDFRWHFRHWLLFLHLMMHWLLRLLHFFAAFLSMIIIIFMPLSFRYAAAAIFAAWCRDAFAIIFAAITLLAIIDIMRHYAIFFRYFLSMLKMPLTCRFSPLRCHWCHYFIDADAIILLTPFHFAASFFADIIISSFHFRCFSSFRHYVFLRCHRWLFQPLSDCHYAPCFRCLIIDYYCRFDADYCHYLLITLRQMLRRLFRLLMPLPLVAIISSPLMFTLMFYATMLLFSLMPADYAFFISFISFSPCWYYALLPFFVERCAIISPRLHYFHTPCSPCHWAADVSCHVIFIDTLRHGFRHLRRFRAYAFADAIDAIIIFFAATFCVAAMLYLMLIDVTAIARWWCWLMIIFAAMIIFISIITFSIISMMPLFFIDYFIIDGYAILQRLFRHCCRDADITFFHFD